jgi:hypothetical protein
MTAKNVFVAGTDILASTMNENFATVPYVMESGSISVTGTQAITFTAGRFSVAPNVFLTVNSNAGTASSATITGLTSSGATIAVWTGSTAATVARTVYWTAIQMKSGVANG